VITYVGNLKTGRDYLCG